jgi:P63C domain
MSNEKLPKATHSGTLEIGDAELGCHVLEDGRRLLSGRAVTRAMGLTGRGQGMARFLESKSLRSFISSDLRLAMEKPVVFTLAAGGMRPTHGYEAQVLPDLCSAVLAADEAGALRPHQKMLAVQARILSRAFSAVGIIALVDEATGYQNVRARRALEKILEEFISKELVRWAKRFPDEFYEQMFRLRGWRYAEIGTVKRPGVVGKWTNDFVYARLAPGVLTELQQKNPADEQGRRKHRHHQWLTEDVGHPKLREHLTAVIALMRASTTWEMFTRLLNRALPRYSETLPLFPDLDNPEGDKMTS